MLEQTGGTGTSDYGYIGGGANPSGSISNIHRIDYSNDTATAPSRNNLWGVSTRSDCYWKFFLWIFCWISFRHSNKLSAFSKLDFSNDTAAVTTNISTGGNYICGFGSASAKEFGLNIFGPAVVENIVTQSYPTTSFGYFAGGYVNYY